jgi:hypothetical protein
MSGRPFDKCPFGMGPLIALHPFLIGSSVNTEALYAALAELASCESVKGSGLMPYTVRKIRNLFKESMKARMLADIGIVP